MGILAIKSMIYSGYCLFNCFTISFALSEWNIGLFLVADDCSNIVATRAAFYSTKIQFAINQNENILRVTAHKFISVVVNY